MFSYRTPCGERRKPSLGTYGQITVDQARKLALDFLASVRGGADPSQERQVARTAPMVKHLADRFMVEHSEARNCQPCQRAPKFPRLWASKVPWFG